MVYIQLKQKTEIQGGYQSNFYLSDQYFNQ